MKIWVLGCHSALILLGLFQKKKKNDFLGVYNLYWPYLEWVSPPSQVEEWSQGEPWRRWAHRGRSGWRSSTGFDAWYTTNQIERGPGKSGTLCVWWRWCPRTAQGSNHKSHCSFSQELLENILVNVVLSNLNSSEMFLWIILTLTEVPFHQRRLQRMITCYDRRHSLTQ